MSKKGKTSSHAGTFLKDLIFLVPFFLISFFSLRGSVPSQDPFWITFWAGLVGLAMTATGWIAYRMFKVVLLDQLEMDRNGGPKK